MKVKPITRTVRSWKSVLIVSLLFFTLALMVVSANAQTGGVHIWVKPDSPTELVADGKSQTQLLLDMEDCKWGSTGMIQGQIKLTLGVTLNPASIDTLDLSKVDFPVELTLTAGSRSGMAKVEVSVNYCTEGNIMLVGQCSSSLEKVPKTCTGEFEIMINPAPVSEDTSSESDEEGSESEEFAVAIGCTPGGPQVGAQVTCTASVSGANDGELLEYVWTLERNAGERSKVGNFSWKGAETGYYEVAVEVFGEDRTTSKTLRVEVVESGGEEVEETTQDTTLNESADAPSLVRSLEAFLGAAGLSGVDPARVAAAGGSAAVLITAWVIINHRAGVSMEKLEQALGQWRWRLGEGSEPGPAEGPKEVPNQVPEAGKIGAGAKKPASIPEGGKISAGSGVHASASAQIDEPESKVGVEAQHPGSLAAGARALSGESGEARVKRAVDDIEDYRQALDKTFEGFDKELAKVPKEVKETEFWKKNVAPQLKKLENMAMKDKSAKLKEFLGVMKELLQVRQQVDADLSSLSKDEREGIVWLERGLLGGSKALNKLHNNLITDPAIAAAKAMLSKDLAAAAEKFFKQHQTDFENMTKGISELPRRGAQAVTKAQHRELITGQIKEDMNRAYDSKGFKDQTPANFGKGWDKAERAYRWVAESASNAKKWLGQYVVFLRDVSPRRE
jgi:hypothetical protein